MIGFTYTRDGDVIRLTHPDQPDESATITLDEAREAHAALGWALGVAAATPTELPGDYHARVLASMGVQGEADRDGLVFDRVELTWGGR